MCKSDQEAKCQDRTDLSFCMCGEEKWLCVETGQCIPYDEVCSGEDDCADDSDENITFCDNVWTCSDHHTYLSGELLLNFVVQPLPFEILFALHQFPGECLDDVKMCNGVIELWDGKDEDNCVDWKCIQGRWKCGGSGMCISVGHVCDGDYDCGHFHYTDEANCESWTCAFGRWQCADGIQCIPSYFVCNYHPDCQDSSD